MRRWIVMALLLALPGCRSNTGRPAHLPEPEVYAPGQTLPRTIITLGVNDLLRVQVLGQPELSTPEAGHRVDMNGSLALPLVGEVVILGMTVREAQAEIRRRLAEFVIEPDVTLTVAEYGARSFFVFGQVEEPGEYLLDRPLNALQALSKAGRFLQGAERDHVVLLRGPPEQLQVYEMDATRAGFDGLLAVQPNDLFFVRRTRKGYFADELLPIITAFSSSINSAAYIGLVVEEFDD